MKPFPSYHNRVIIVTGASSGIGAAFARTLAQQGAQVVLLARREAPLQQVAQACGPSALAIVGDVTHAADRVRVVEQTLECFGRVDSLINNAGVGDGGTFTEITHDQIEAVLTTNLVAALHMTHLVVPRLIEAGGGLIINVSSPMGKLGLPGRTLYNASKAGLSMASQTLRRELRPYGIHVLDCLPGFTRSEMIPPEREAELPRFLSVLDAEVVAARTLQAALQGWAEVMTGGGVARAGLWLNKLAPRLGDWLVQGIKL
jgi:3-oxoacyl-[acyl-carrier protein] reductase